jgi:hypothetical protein
MAALTEARYVVTARDGVRYFCPTCAGREFIHVRRQFFSDGVIDTATCCKCERVLWRQDHETA